jgi:AcrR family transcriptional regulator
MDREGIDAVTMRRLGRELGVEAMSLYNHVRGKEGVMTGILEVLLAEFDVPEDEGGDWVERIRHLAREFRRLLQAHPNLIRLIAEQAGRPISVEALRPAEATLSSLRRAGLSPEATTHAYRALAGYVMGSVLLELGGFSSDAARVSLWAHPSAMAGLPLDRTPTFVEMLPHLLQCDADAEFEFGLEVLLAGLRARLQSA